MSQEKPPREKAPKKKPDQKKFPQKKKTSQAKATDIDADAIDKAKAGEYPESIAADITPKRLQLSRTDP